MTIEQLPVTRKCPDQSTRDAKPLSDDKRLEIWTAIGQHMQGDDTPPEQVINETYGGDVEHYLRVMARWHNIAIS